MTKESQTDRIKARQATQSQPGKSLTGRHPSTQSWWCTIHADSHVPR